MASQIVWHRYKGTDGQPKLTASEQWATDLPVNYFISRAVSDTQWNAFTVTLLQENCQNSFAMFCVACRRKKSCRCYISVCRPVCLLRGLFQFLQYIRQHQQFDQLINAKKVNYYHQHALALTKCLGFYNARALCCVRHFTPSSLPPFSPVSHSKVTTFTSFCYIREQVNVSLTCKIAIPFPLPPIYYTLVFLMVWKLWLILCVNWNMSRPCVYVFRSLHFICNLISFHKCHNFFECKMLAFEVLKIAHLLKTENYLELEIQVFNE